VTPGGRPQHQCCQPASGIPGTDQHRLYGSSYLPHICSIYCSELGPSQYFELGVDLACKSWLAKRNFSAQASRTPLGAMRQSTQNCVCVLKCCVSLCNCALAALIWRLSRGVSAVRKC
jgi:hypothetical protein